MNAEATETTATSAEWVNEEEEPTRVHLVPDSRPEGHSAEPHVATHAEVISADAGTTPTPAYHGSASYGSPSNEVPPPDLDSVEDIDAFLESAPHADLHLVEKRRKRPRPPSPSEHRIETRLRASQTTLIGINGPHIAGPTIPGEVTPPAGTSDAVLTSANHVEAPDEVAPVVASPTHLDDVAQVTSNTEPGVAPSTVVVAAGLVPAEPTIIVKEQHVPEAPAREALSDAPTTQDTTAETPKKSGRRFTAIALGIAALGALFIGRHATQPTGPESANAARPLQPELHAAMPAPLGAPVGESMAAAQAVEEVPAAPAAPAASSVVTVEPNGRQMAANGKSVPKLGEPAAKERVVKKAVVADEDDEAADVNEFDSDAAASALDEAAARASACRQADDPSGVAVVTITFAPSGRVTTATIAGPPFVGTATGSCIAAKLRTARVPKFDGKFVTVKKTVTVQ